MPRPPRMKRITPRTGRRIGGAVAMTALAAGILTMPSAHPQAKLIVLARPGQVGAAERAVRSVGGSVGLPLPSLDGFAATLNQADLPVVASNPAVLAVTPDRAVQLAGGTYGSAGDFYRPVDDPYSLYNLETDMGVRSAWERSTGAGIGVALVDSGVTTVSGLGNPGQVITGPDLTPEASNPATDGVDTFGHGTFMAGIIAGRDGSAPASPSDSTDFYGVAPDAHIVSVKVAQRDGTTSTSQVISGIEWVIDHAHDPGLNIRVLNLSFGADPYSGAQVDPLMIAADEALYSGIVVVVSAGNQGAHASGLTAPAADPNLIAVGAEEPQGSDLAAGLMADFSNDGDGYRNPDVVAPGEHVQSLADPGSYVADNYASTGAIGTRFFRGSGTSEAAAFTSGVAALLLQAHPGWTPAQVKGALTSTAVHLVSADPAQSGHGAVDVTAALALVSPPAAPMRPIHGIGIPCPPAYKGLNPGALRGDNKTVSSVSVPAPQFCAGASVPDGSSWGTPPGGSSWGATTGDSSGKPSGSSWSGSSWSGSSWSGSSWSGSSWSGSSWSGSSWSGSSWSGSSWSSAFWQSSRWK